MRRGDRVLVVLAWLAFVVTAAVHGLAATADPGSAGHRHTAQTKPAAPAPKAPAAAPKVAKKSPAAEYTPTVRFRLRTELADGKMAFVGVGGPIEGIVNPPLRVAEGDVVQVTLINNDGVEHDVVFPSSSAGTDKVERGRAPAASPCSGRTRAASSRTSAPCPATGRRGWKASSSWGPARGPVAALPPSVSIARDPADLPGPLAAGPPRTFQIELEAVELSAGWRTRRRTPTGRSTARCRGRSSACGSATRSS